MKHIINSRGQALAEFALVIPLLLLILLGIVQFTIIYSIRSMVAYAAYVSCRVGIVNYDRNGKYNLEKIKTAANRVMQPVIDAGRDGEKGQIEDNRLIIVSPVENSSIYPGNVRIKGKWPILKVSILYKYKPFLPLIKNLLTDSNSDKYYMHIKGEAEMPVEIGDF